MFRSFIQGKADVSEKKEGEAEGDAEGEAEVAEEVTEEGAEKGAEEGDEEGATETTSETTANCAGDTFEYKKGKPIVSITFSLSEENPFEVNVGTSMTSYKKSDKKAYPVLCEINGFGSESVKIEPLKNKGCIEKNLPKVLAPILTQLNSLLLDQYNAYYDTTKYEAFLTAQSEFLKAPTPKSAEKGQDEGEEEQEGQTPTQIRMEGQMTDPEQRNRAEKAQKLIKTLQDISTEEIAVNDGDKLSKITTQNEIKDEKLKNLKELLENHKDNVFLLPLKYGEQYIFMTKDGIVSNGIKIFSYNDISIKENKIDVNALIYQFLWDLNEENYEQALKIIDGEVDNKYIDSSLLKDGVFLRGGTRRTLSKKLFKKRTTRRSRK